MVYADRMRATLTGRAGDWLARNTRPRLIVVSSYGLATFVAWQACNSLSEFGVRDPLARTSIGFATAYLTYVVAVSGWLICMPTLDQQALLDGASDQIATRSPMEVAPGWLDDVAEGVRAAIRQDARNAGGIAIGAAVLGILFLLTFWTYYAPWYMGELMVLAGKVHHGSIGDVASNAWIVEPIRQSFWMAFGLLLHFLLLGSLLTLKFA